MHPASEVKLDFRRAERIGFDEAILCQGKSTAHLTEIIHRARIENARFLFTRLSQDQLENLSNEDRRALQYEPISRTAFFGEPRAAEGPARICVLAAGTSDAPVTREIQRTLQFNGIASTLFADVGVAGLWRLTEKLDVIRTHPIAIVVAGMDAALPTVVGGLYGGVIIGVPTSTGYGVAEGGTTALHSMLSSCAPGIVTLNIDNGYGAACAAMRMLRAFEPKDR
ncbi:MAG: nickel pincer cofactor biosynthesis protein LarB [Myxococcaceae bacterium]